MAEELMLQSTQAGWICPPSGLMEPLALLTYRPLLWKLDLRRPLISRVNCRRLCRRVFYCHHQLLKSSYITTISINSLPETISNLCRAEGKITAGRLCSQAPCPAVCHMTGDAHRLPLLLRHRSLLMDTIQTWRLRTPAVEPVHRWWESQFRSTCIYSSIT